MSDRLIPTEAQEGLAFVAYLRRKGLKFTHIPLETGSSLEARRRAIRMKQQGTARGFPDYLIFVRDCAIAIELKRRKGGRVTPEQKEWLETLNDAGIQARVCAGYEQAVEFVEETQRLAMNRYIPREVA